ncbi:hypothetical protein F3I27_07650 [Pantoea sp. Bo_2]|uniref:hypothetical protein n=1 Tax=unclassified Pantoea TaxID=2630326 RepID=UPI0012324442|nr:MULTISPECIES: hypothetical protein [unclassified Pantoea]KAA5948719.1 hypothetical protein F3I57_05160 [Pantoea sp. VH_3]KAA5955102.1 hypothetical protein F3I56_04840 [Pantoea sp. VH_25]KAA5957569.1 hypothetical protein F3I55_08765 [Pantoea sp. VH_24]KAA5962583.1 hypothetical protein F3I53_05455 [Pantoea sp. VH_16]KAA5966812.1 hypothetical protein F3I54_05875 [Pantoea sp. VH_18]
MNKKHAYIEHRPKSSDKKATTEHHVVIVDGEVVKKTNTQKEAADWAIEMDFAVHVARERHLQNRDIPDHWRNYP